MTDPEVLSLALRALEVKWERMPGGGFSDKAIVSVITRGGSDRHFFRVEEEGLSAVVLVQPGGGPEFDRYIRVGDFLRESGIPVPEFYSIDIGGAVVMEDLGDMHLVDVLDGADPKAELAFYRDCIDILF